MDTSNTSLLAAESQGAEKRAKIENCLNSLSCKNIAVICIRLVVISITVCIFYSYLPFGADNNDIGKTSTNSHRLKRELPLVWQQAIDADEDLCRADATDLFPTNFLDNTTSTNGGFVVHLLIATYSMCCVAQLSDHYFVPSIEKITESLGMSSHAAGASFMAIGVTIPEILFSTLEAVRFESDSGLSVIESVVMFKSLLTIGAVGSLAGYVIPLSVYPLVRDSVLYVYSLLLLLLFIQGEGSLNTVEVVIMLVVYTLYTIIIDFDKSFEKKFNQIRFERNGEIDAVPADEMLGEGELELKMTMFQRRRSSHLVAGQTTVDIGELKSTEHDLENMSVGDNRVIEYMKAVGDVTHWSKTPTVRNTPNVGSVTNLTGEATGETGKDADAEDNWDKNTTVEMEYIEDANLVHRDSKRKSTITTKPLQKPEPLWHKFMWFISLPAALLHMCLIPDPRKVNTWQGRLYPLTFILSTLMITVYTFVIIWMFALFANSVYIPDTITVDTLIAAGLAFPGVYISVCLARDGYADMAVANAMGSNIFGICLGVSLPFIANGGALTHSDHRNLEHTLMLSCMAALQVVVVLMIWWSSWTLDKRNGIATLGLFFVMLIYLILSHVNGLLFVPRLPICKNFNF